MIRRRYLILITAYSFVFTLFHTNILIGGEVSPFLKEMKTLQGISYLSGGIGLEEREALNQLGREYSLKLVFALSTGEYLNGVRVEITDAKGEHIINTVSSGPWFFALLKDDSYQILVTVKSITKTLNDIQIKGGGQKVIHIHWP